MVMDSHGSLEESAASVRVLLLDDEPATLMLRASILRKHGYTCVPASSYEEALALFEHIDIAVLDYHLGAGQFGSDVAVLLRRSHPEVPIIILSATLDHFFGGAEDMHLLKGYSSNDQLLAALQSIQARRQGALALADADQFFYSRVCHAIGPGALVQIFDARGAWLYCNEDAADYLGHEREWFPGRSPLPDLPASLHHWQQVILDVATRRETYIDRTRYGLLHLAEIAREDPPAGPETSWSLMAFPVALPSGSIGVVLTARNVAIHQLPVTG
jgi:two-component system OmpR family response regulator